MTYDHQMLTYLVLSYLILWAVNLKDVGRIRIEKLVQANSTWRILIKHLDFNSLEVFCEGSSIGSLGSVLDGRVLGGSGLLSGTFSTAI